jgi:hypothetical protein
MYICFIQIVFDLVFTAVKITIDTGNALYDLAAVPVIILSLILGGAAATMMIVALRSQKARSG